MGGSPLATAGKLFNMLKSFLSKISSPIRGFDIQDVKVKAEGTEFFTLFQLGKQKDARTGEEITDIKGNSIDLGVLLKATNVKQVFNPILNALNNLTPEQKAIILSDDMNGVSPLLDVLFGKDRQSGLLGTDFSTGKIPFQEPATWNGVDWTWTNLADKLFVYSLECSAPGKEYGAINNQTLSKCSELISEYLVKQGVIDSASEVVADRWTFVLPLLYRIQIWLKKYYEDAKAKYINTNKKESQEQNNGEEQENPSPEEGQQENSGGDESVAQTASKHITVKLQRITGTSEIELLGLNSNCLPGDTLNYIDDIINQDEFYDALTEEPQTFSVNIDDDGYDIEQCEDCEIDPCKSLEEVFKSGIRAYRNLYTLHWMSAGNDMMKLHNLSEDMYKELIDEIDVIGELLVEKCGTVPALDFPCDYIPVQQYDFQTGLDYIKSLIQMYIDCIDCTYPNQTSDVQSTLDEWLRYWNKQLNYFVKGQEA